MAHSRLLRWILVGWLLWQTSARSRADESWIWAKHVGGSWGTGIVVDSASDIYVLGEFVAGSGTGNVQGVTLINRTNGLPTSFLAKYDAEGSFQWVRQLGVADVALELDAAGNALLAGSFEGTVTMGNTTLTSAPEKAGIFVARYDAAGGLISAQLIGRAASTSNIRIAADRQGNYYLAGAAKNHVLISNGPGNYFGAERQTDVFTTKIDRTGKGLWLTVAGGKDNDYPAGIAFDNAGNCYVMGELGESQADFSPGVGRVGRESRLTFITKIDPNGSFAWVKKIEAGYGTLFGTIAVDSSSNIYVVRNFVGKASIEDASFIGSRLSDFLMVKLNSEGSVVWARKGGNVGNELFSEVRRIALDERDDLYLTGVFDLPISTNAVAHVGPFPILRKHSSRGDLLGERTGNGSLTGNAIALDQSGGVHIAGVYTSNASLGAARLTGDNLPAAFIAKTSKISNVIEGFTNIRITNQREIRVSANGNTGARFRIESSTNLMDWIPFIEGATGPLEFSDSPTSRTPYKFFRFVKLP